MAFNRRVQRTLQALSNNMNNNAPLVAKEDFSNDDELFRHVYDMAKKGQKGTWKAPLGKDSWETFEKFLAADGITPTNNMKVKVETSYNWRDNQPIVSQRYLHVIVGVNDNGCDDLRELYFKGDQTTEKFPQTYGELKEQMEYGIFKRAPEKLKDGSWKTFQWKQAVRFRTVANSTAANSVFDTTDNI